MSAPRRHAGLNVPLFSLRSARSWGIGELTDLATFSQWLACAGFTRLLLLPLGTMPAGQTSPYSAISTLSIDPLFISLADVPDFVRIGGEGGLSAAARNALDGARQAPAVRHDLVTVAKEEALGLAFRAFLADEWEQLTPRAADLAGYIARERFWLDDYALFLALTTAHGAGWQHWPPGLRDREPQALDEARRQLSREVLEHQYRQWLAEGQWQASRLAANAHGIALFGDLPFVAAPDSPEVWARAHEFDLTVSVGVPPDAFSPTGQDWGLPLYRWDVIRRSEYAWLQARGRRMAALYDGLRVDHVIGLYRTYGRPAQGDAFFSPADEATQTEQGERVLDILRGCGLDIIAEDLGVIPDFVRRSLEKIHVPGCRVLRWERDWHAHGAPFVEPRGFPARSAAMTGTHDTEPLTVWWAGLGDHDREQLLRLEAFQGLGPSADWTSAHRDASLHAVYSAGSQEVFVPIQDVFGWDGRVNLPGTVGPWNWTWTLPWTVDALPEQPEALERAAFLRALAARTARG